MQEYTGIRKVNRMDCPVCDKKLVMATENRLGGVMVYACCKTARCSYVSEGFISQTEFKKVAPTNQ